MSARPLEFQQETADLICDRLADGESLRAICESKKLPARSTVFKWLNLVPEFADQYTRARELGGEADADDVSHYARMAANGKIEPAAARAAIDGLKWSAAKRQPKKYGDKIEHGGSVGVTLVMQDLDDQL